MYTDISVSGFRRTDSWASRQLSQSGQLGRSLGTWAVGVVWVIEGRGDNPLPPMQSMLVFVVAAKAGHASHQSRSGQLWW